MLSDARTAIIGVMGEADAGHRLTAELRAHYDIPTFALAETAREYVAEEARPDPPQQILAPTGYHAPEKRLAQYGPEHFAQQVIADMNKRQDDWPVICLTDPLTPALAMALREQFGAELIVVWAYEGETAVPPDSHLRPAPKIADIQIAVNDVDESLTAQIEQRLIPRLPKKELNEK